MGIVEGHGECQAVPVLLRRFAANRGQYDIGVPPPIRCPKGKILPGKDRINRQELSRTMHLAVSKLSNVDTGAILVLMDADKLCPAEVGPEIAKLATDIRPDVCIGVVLAKREYETWFLAAMESLRGHRGIRADARTPASPEEISDAKGRLRRQMIPGRKYSEPVDQPALTAVFDFEQAQACRSFREMQAVADGILDELQDDPR